MEQNREKYCDTCEHIRQITVDDWQCFNENSDKYGCSIYYDTPACKYYEKGFLFNPQPRRAIEKWKPEKVIFEDVGYDIHNDVNVYACVCPDCGLEIIIFTDDDISDDCDSDEPEDMFKSSMIHHGYMGLNNFCNRCGKRLDWGEYHK